jgi:hypothetical protein
MNNAQLKRYFSWRPDPLAEATDAFQQDWSKLGLAWANPPFKMISRVIQKARNDKAELILLTPDWKQPWFPMLMQMSLEPPMCIRPSKDLFIPGIQNHSTFVRDPKWSLLAWRISGRL